MDTCSAHVAIAFRSNPAPLLVTKVEPTFTTIRFDSEIVLFIVITRLKNGGPQRALPLGHDLYEAHLNSLEFHNTGDRNLRL